jgi:hypothetical protein
MEAQEIQLKQLLVSFPLYSDVAARIVVEMLIMSTLKSQLF